MSQRRIYKVLTSNCKANRMPLLESINDLRHRLLLLVCVLNGVLLLRKKYTYILYKIYIYIYWVDKCKNENPFNIFFIGLLFCILLIQNETKCSNLRSKRCMNKIIISSYVAKKYINDRIWNWNNVSNVVIWHLLTL